jgi:hypothetical protein
MTGTYGYVQRGPGNPGCWLALPRARLAVGSVRTAGLCRYLLALGDDSSPGGWFTVRQGVTRPGGLNGMRERAENPGGTRAGKDECRPCRQLPGHRSPAAQRPGSKRATASAPRESDHPLAWQADQDNRTCDGVNRPH